VIFEPPTLGLESCATNSPTMRVGRKPIGDSHRRETRLNQPVLASTEYSVSAISTRFRPFRFAR
jgi:hypothetical protein